MLKQDRTRRRAFSLIELVIVVVIIAIIGAIAIPRLSRGAEGAADSALIADLSVLRSAIDLYTTEHTGTAPTLGAFVNQMTTFTDIGGTANPAKGGTFIYGPYLRAIPPLPVGDEKGSKGITDTPGNVGSGWVYTAGTGSIVANTTSEMDVSGTPYNTY